MNPAALNATRSGKLSVEAPIVARETLQPRQERPRPIAPLQTKAGHVKSLRAAKTLLVDNYDSYTYNLFQLLAQINGAVPTVVRNDELSWRELKAQLARGLYDNIVISPGPGTPARAADIGVCIQLLEELDDVPVLGVCLGMQALALAHGAAVVPAPEPVHGYLSEVSHNGHPLFSGIPSGRGQGYSVVRYHSLAVCPATLPSCLEPIAWTCNHHQAVQLQQDKDKVASLLAADRQADAAVLMGLAHTSRPHYGVQFHPESVATAFGGKLLHNFREITHQHAESRSLFTPAFASQREEASSAPERRQAEPAATLDVRWRVLPNSLEALGGSEAIFWACFGQGTAADTFWLDSSSEERQRFSYMGGRGGPLWQRLSYKLPPPSTSPSSASSHPIGSITIQDALGHTSEMQSGFLDYLETELRQQRCASHDSASQLPFEFVGGLVGYLGYEMKGECGSPSPHVSPHPDAAMFLADRLLVVDHATSDVYLVAMHTLGCQSSISAAEEWLADKSACLQDMQASAHVPAPATSSSDDNGDAGRLVQSSTDTVAASQSGISSSNIDREPALSSSNHIASSREFDEHAVPSHSWQEQQAEPTWEEQLDGMACLEARRSRGGYVQDIGQCLEALRAGESYELCLTTMLRRKGRVDARRLYSHLRNSNPSAHAAWLSFGGGGPTVCCSSPERFLKGSRGGLVEARPIKGTAARFQDPEKDVQARTALASSEKARAENLMIVDLLRNDLGRFCEVGSVHVSGLMEVESYATVHNLVSTVRGTRKQGSSIVDCLRAAFPGGSMTGAPKLRSMQILDRLENGPRGIYSGCLGFIGFNDSFDLNIVIRTAVVSDKEVTIGAGGAIVLHSDPESEYEEMRLKARAIVSAIDKCSLEA